MPNIFIFLSGSSLFSSFVVLEGFLILLFSLYKFCYRGEKGIGLTCLSNLPGLVKAGSRISGRFVAAITIIPYKIKMLNKLGNREKLIKHSQMFKT